MPSRSRWPPASPTGPPSLSTTPTSSMRGGSAWCGSRWPGPCARSRVCPRGTCRQPHPSGRHGMPAWLWPIVLLAIPPLSGRVVDEAGLLSVEQKAALVQDLERLERETSVQIVVATLPSLEGRPLEEVSLRMAAAWGLGRRGRDNGILLLVARDERRVRIEVGYGLEAVIPDALANRIIEERIAPRFRERDYFGGLLAAVQGLALAAQREYPSAPPVSATPNGAIPDRNQVHVGAFLICGFFWFVSFGVLSDSFALKHPLVPASLTAVFTLMFLSIAGWMTLAIVLVALPVAFGVGWLMAPFGQVLHQLNRSARAGTWSSRGYSSSDFWSGSSYGGGGSSGGDFSGGGGSFGGGGASGSW